MANSKSTKKACAPATPPRSKPAGGHGSARYRQQPATPSTVASSPKSTSPASRASGSTTGSRKRSSSAKPSGVRKKRTPTTSSTSKKKPTSKGSDPDRSMAKTASRKLKMTDSIASKSTGDGQFEKPDAANVNWLDPECVTNLLTKLDQDEAIDEDDYEGNVFNLVSHYKPQEIGLALMRTKMLLGDTNPTIPKLKKDKEEALVCLCIDNFNMKADTIGGKEDDMDVDDEVPETVDLLR